MNWYLMALKKYAVFSGRAQRKEFWYFTLFSILISFSIEVADLLIVMYGFDLGLNILASIYGLGVLIPSIAVGVRRLHDTNRSGWWYLLGPATLFLIPVFSSFPILNVVAIVLAIIGNLLLIYFFVQDSDLQENRFGPIPRGRLI